MEIFSFHKLMFFFDFVTIWWQVMMSYQCFSQFLSHKPRYFVTLHEVSCTQATTTYDQQLTLSDQNFCVNFFVHCDNFFSLFFICLTFEAVSTFWISIDGYNFQHWVIYQRCVNSWQITYQKLSKLVVKIFIVSYDIFWGTIFYKLLSLFESFECSTKFGIFNRNSLKLFDSNMWSVTCKNHVCLW